MLAMADEKEEKQQKASCVSGKPQTQQEEHINQNSCLTFMIQKKNELGRWGALFPRKTRARKRVGRRAACCSPSESENTR
jgi:hypothetical protein